MFVYLGPVSLDPGAAGVGGDVAAAVIGIVLTGCMATAVLLVLGICTLLEKLGVLKTDSAESGVAESTESAEVEEVQSAEPPADSPSSVRALVTMGAGLPASRLSPMNPDVPAAPASSVSPRVPGETGHWIRPPAAGGRQSPWSGILVASGRTVDAAQLGELYAVIPREWLNWAPCWVPVGSLLGPCWVNEQTNKRTSLE